MILRFALKLRIQILRYSVYSCLIFIYKMKHLLYLQVMTVQQSKVISFVLIRIFFVLVKYTVCSNIK